MHQTIAIRDYVAKQHNLTGDNLAMFHKLVELSEEGGLDSEDKFAAETGSASEEVMAAIEDFLNRLLGPELE